MRWFRRFSRSSLKVWLIIVVFLLGTIAMLYALALGRIPGVPDANLKTVTISASPGADKSPLTLFMEPPTGMLEAGGPDQLLSLQFTDTSKQPIRLGPVRTQDSSCFALLEVEPGPALLAGGETRVFRYRLALSEIGKTERCSGRHALSFRYAYTVQNPPRKGKAVTWGTEQERSVSTGPILITTRQKVIAERFFHIAGAIAIPILLAMATFLIQQLQDQKAARGKEQELKLEVWKMIFPVIDKHFRRYYVPIYREMDVLRDEMKRTPPDKINVVAEVLILRALFEQLIRNVGGYYFRSKEGEHVCSQLTNALWVECRRLAGDQDLFSEAVAAVQPRGTLLVAKECLIKFGHPDWLDAFGDALLTTAALAKLGRLLDLSIEVMDFENNFLWYPEWYERAPTIDLENLKSVDLGFNRAAKHEWIKSLAAYRKDLPPECILIKKKSRWTAALLHRFTSLDRP